MLPTLPASSRKIFAGCPIVTECLWMGENPGFASELTLVQTLAPMTRLISQANPF
jgi:hypothetical protein